MKFNINKKLAVAGVSLTALVSSAVMALPSSWEERIYYSDATYTQFVGERSQTCTGLVVVSGQVTRYSKVLVSGSCGGGGGL